MKAKKANKAIMPGRYTAEPPEDGVVVFLIGMRFNRLWKVWQWLPVFRAMPRMLSELSRNQSLGLLHAQTFFSGRTALVLQYWASAEQLDAYARASDQSHLPAWRAFNRAIAGGGDVGIFHETYEVGKGHIECVYGNMPLFGLAAATRQVPVTAGQHTSTARRLGDPSIDDPAVAPY